MARINSDSSSAIFLDVLASSYHVSTFRRGGIGLSVSIGMGLMGTGPGSHCYHIGACFCIYGACVCVCVLTVVIANVHHEVAVFCKNLPVGETSTEPNRNDISSLQGASVSNGGGGLGDGSLPRATSESHDLR